VAAVNAAVLPAFESSVAPPPAWRQALVLTRRTLTNNWRDLGVFWMRLVMYVMLCFCIGFIYFRMDSSWKSVFSRTALLFFVVAFLTFMSISAFPAFVEDMKVFTRERLNGARAQACVAVWRPAGCGSRRVPNQHRARFALHRYAGYYGVATFVIANTASCALSPPAREGGMRAADACAPAVLAPQRCRSSRSSPSRPAPRCTSWPI
jgi:hypothetical protein